MNDTTAPPPPPAEDAAAKLAEIRLVLDAFDWETDDRQYALEQIAQIADRDPAASGSPS